MTASSDAPSLLENVDDDALVKAVERFYDRMLADHRVSHYFDNVSLARLRAHQRSFLVAALGDPGTFNGLTLQHAHYRLRLTDAEFDITAAHLVDSLLEAGVPAMLRAEMARRLERVRVHVVAPKVVKRSRWGMAWGRKE